MLSKSSVLTLWTLLATWLGHFTDVTVSHGPAEPEDRSMGALGRGCVPGRCALFGEL